VTEPAESRPVPVIDSSVHVFFRSNNDFRDHLREPFRSRGFPDYEMPSYGAPGGEYSPLARTREGRTPVPIRTSSAGTCSARAGWMSPCCTR
jgi:hypothetical protein